MHFVPLSISLLLALAGFVSASPKKVDVHLNGNGDSGKNVEFVATTITTSFGSLQTSSCDDGSCDSSNSSLSCDGDCSSDYSSTLTYSTVTVTVTVTASDCTSTSYNSSSSNSTSDSSNTTLSSYGSTTTYNANSYYTPTYTTSLAYSTDSSCSGSDCGSSSLNDVVDGESVSELIEALEEKGINAANLKDALSKKSRARRSPDVQRRGTQYLNRLD